MTWDVNGPRCSRCGHVQNVALDGWRVEGLVACMERALTLPKGSERHERIMGIVQDYGVSLRTAQRYVKRARAAA